MTVALIVGAALAVACVILVALPFLREPSAQNDRLDALSGAEQRRLALALASLKELEFDHRTGKVSDEDYRAQVGPLRRQAAETMRALERREEDKRTKVPSRG